MTEAREGVSDGVRAHVEDRWGPPAREASFSRERSPREIRVLKWNASQTREGVAVYVTSGASDVAHPSSPLHRWEFFTGFDPDEDACASSLAVIALAVGTAEGVGHGHTIEVEGGLWPGTRMDAWLLLSQASEILPGLDRPGGVHVEFLQAIPLYPEERTWKVVNGADALLDDWNRRGVQFWDPRRASSA